DDSTATLQEYASHYCALAPASISASADITGLPTSVVSADQSSSAAATSSTSAIPSTLPSGATAARASWAVGLVATATVVLLALV
ncbi:hypothetical protein HK405_014592, partial [Cladochytrium tenue]